MALNDYAALDEEDFYGQDFERPGYVSVWLGVAERPENADDIDVLQDLCGVGYYELDMQGSNCFDFELVPAERLLADLSYSSSYIDEALKAARSKGVASARWAVAQYDFAYDSTRIKRSIAKDPTFLGAFSYSAQ